MKPALISAESYQEVSLFSPNHPTATQRGDVAGLRMMSGQVVLCAYLTIDELRELFYASGDLLIAIVEAQQEAQPNDQ